MLDVAVGSTAPGAIPAVEREGRHPLTASRRRRVGRSSLVVLLVGLIATGTLSWVTYAVNDRNETRLLKLQTEQTGTVLQVILPTIQTPLASAAEIAATSGGSSTRFRTYISSYVGSTKTFISASLWRLSGSVAHRVAVVGAAPELGAMPARPHTFLSAAARTAKLTVVGPIGASHPRLGYAFAAAGASPSYVVYAESSLPPNRRAVVEPGSPYSSLRFALYLGRRVRADKLLETNASHAPITGRSATVVVPFGAAALTLVASPARQLGGTLSAWLWWIIAVAGVVFTLVAAFVAGRLVRRRLAAERLTDEVQGLLGEQRSIAESLQRALLPQTMPAVSGVEVAARYIPGVNGAEIGGDWYDVIVVDDQRFLFVIGDVSGRGIEAGSVMASMHFAIRAFVSEGHSPSTILQSLTGLLRLGRDGHFATVLCGLVDVGRHEITIANAGHLPPLLIGSEGGQFLSTAVGPPIGVTPGVAYRPVTISVPARAALLLYTDGLVERRGQSIDDGLKRLHDLAVGTDEPLERLLGTMVNQLNRDGDDDTAILGVQWLT